MAPEQMSTTILEPVQPGGDPQPRSSVDALATSATTPVRSAHFGIAISRALGSVVVSVHGDLDVPGARHLGGVLADIIDGQGNRAVIVDLHDASAVDASNLAVFAAAATRADQRGAALSLSDPPPLLHRAMVLMGLGQRVRTTRHDGRCPSPAAAFGRIAAPRGRSVHPAGHPGAQIRLRGV